MAVVVRLKSNSSVSSKRLFTTPVTFADCPLLYSKSLPKDVVANKLSLDSSPTSQDFPPEILPDTPVVPLVDTGSTP